MTTEFALAYIARKMREKGVNDHYLLAFRHVVVKPNRKLEIPASGQIYLLVEGFTHLVRIESDNGVYDLLDAGLNELIHEHTGKITITNRSANYRSFAFVVAIPKPGTGTHSPN